MDAPISRAPRPGPVYRARKRLKAWVAPHPRLYRALLRLWGVAFGLRFLVHAVVSGKLRHRRDSAAFAGFLSRQNTLSFAVDFGPTPDAAALREALAARGLAPAEGGWTFYLPPGPALAAAFPFLTELYPPGAGLKLLKDMRHPDQALYARHELNPAPGSALLRRLTPPAKALVRVGNALHAAGLGPRIWDLVHLRNGTADLAAYVVQHVPGPAPDAAGHAAFMARLQAALRDGDLATMHPSPTGSDDFAPPDCNGNLRLDGAGGPPLYVDFQAFTIADEARLLARIAAAERGVTHFGGGRFFRGGGAYLYQAIPGLEPGKRDVETRWRSIAALLEAAEVRLDGRLLFDVGCNTGLMLYQGLGAGARWGLGWDMPQVAAAAERLLGALGATRVQVRGGEIGPDTDFLAAVPDRFRRGGDGMLFYLAVSDHIGFPAGVAALPWRWMVYEGHADQGVGDQVERLRQVPWLAGAALRGHRMVVDGDSPPRPLLLLDRDPEPAAATE